MTIGYEDLPRPIRSGLVLVDPVLGIPERVIIMQFNPDTLSRTLTPQTTTGESGDRSEALRLTGPAIETRKIPPITTSSTELRGRDVKVHSVQPETPTPSIATFLQRRRADSFRTRRVMRYIGQDPGDEPDNVELWQGTPGRRSVGSRNRMVRVTDPFTGRVYDQMPYSVLVNILGRFNKNAQRRISRDALQMLAGGKVGLTNRQFVRELVQWTQIQEEQRGPAARVTTAMIFNMAANGANSNRINLSQAMALTQMQGVLQQTRRGLRPQLAQARVDLAQRYFSGEDFASFTPREQTLIQGLIDEEVAVVEAWATALNISVSSNIPENEQVPWLFEQIRRRMYKIYGQAYTPRSFTGGGEE